MALYPDPFDALLGLQQALDAFRTSRWLEPRACSHLNTDQRVDLNQSSVAAMAMPAA